MTKHASLLLDKTLYDDLLISTFSGSVKNYDLLSDRQREIEALKITCTVLFCNLEPLQHKRKGVSSINGSGPVKKVKLLEHEDQVDCSQSVTKMDIDFTTVSQTWSTSSGSKTSKSSVEIEEETLRTTQKGELPKEKYRFRMVKNMPASETIMRQISNEYNINCPIEIMEIFDTKLRKFINLKVISDRKKDIETYEEIKAYTPDSCILVLIDTIDIQVTWYDCDSKAIGETKIMNFLLRRKQLMIEAGIMDSTLHNYLDLESKIFCSKDFNHAMSEWIRSFMISIDEKYDTKEVYGPMNKEPSAILPIQLLKTLAKVDEESEERGLFVQWKGKIMPEGFTYNIETAKYKDIEMVEEAMDFIKSENYRDAEKINQECNSIMEEDIIDDILDYWYKNVGKIDTFNFLTPGKNKHMTHLEQLIGIGMKERVFTDEDDDEDMKQREFKSIPKRKYSNVFDEVIRRLNTTVNSKHIPFLQLIEKPPTDGHPIAELCEETLSVLLERVLQSNTAVYASKITNLYMRMGGAYQSGMYTTNKMRSSVSIFPIYCTLHNKDNPKDIKRKIQGFVIKGPHHAKNQTDRIAFITIEFLELNAEAYTLAKRCTNGFVYKGDRSLMIIRQNSIMKEDSSYCSFTINSLFAPANVLGGMTIENPNVYQEQNMKATIQDFVESNSNWIIERFTEGVLFSQIGNSRDEGYLAQLRKLFMVILSWRRKQSCANWDIDAFCKKVNDHLIDNPFSMHFHNTLINLLEIYNLRRRGN